MGNAARVFAVFLIVAASGALNVASIASVFRQSIYKPLARLSGLLAISLLVGGLAILVLDLGRPERVIMAMTHYNFKSILAWNIFLYIGFMLVVAAYLVTLFELRLDWHSGVLGWLAFIWRIVLTTGTGSIFGFLVARQAYDAAIMAPLFIIMSFAFGTGSSLLLMLALSGWHRYQIDPSVFAGLGKLLAIFVAAVLYIALAHHLTNLYAAEHHGVERFILVDGGVYTWLFWLGQVLLGSVVPVGLLLIARNRHAPYVVAVAASLIVLGGLAQMYVIIIAGQAYPFVLFPGKEVSSSFLDGVVTQYAPSLPEIALGIGGVAFALLATVLVMRVLPFIPAPLGHGNRAESSGTDSPARPGC